MRKTIISLAVLSMLMLAIGCGSTEAQKSQAEKAPNFTLKDLNGATVRLSDYKGKTVILNFFATWCPPCRMEMPDFNRIQKEYEKEVKIIAINVGRENPIKVQDFAKANNLTFTIAVDDGSAADLYGPINAIPVTFIIDKNLNIVKKYVGARPKEVFVADIKGLL